MTKIVKAAGRFGVRYGQSVKRRIAKIEERQRKKQACPFCKGLAKRISKGIWVCNRCGKKFAGHAYFLETLYVRPESKFAKKENANVLKDENATPVVAEKKSTKKKTKTQ